MGRSKVAEVAVVRYQDRCVGSGDNVRRVDPGILG
jgi:hypothetical protein